MLCLGSMEGLGRALACCPLSPQSLLSTPLGFSLWSLECGSVGVIPFPPSSRCLWSETRVIPVCSGGCLAALANGLSPCGEKGNQGHWQGSWPSRGQWRCPSPTCPQAHPLGRRCLEEEYEARVLTWKTLMPGPQEDLVSLFSDCFWWLPWVIVHLSISLQASSSSLGGRLGFNPLSSSLKMSGLKNKKGEAWISSSGREPNDVTFLVYLGTPRWVATEEAAP